MQNENNAANGMVLSGGGAFGAYELGVMKALCESGEREFDVLSGTSVGSFNAAVMCQGGDARPALAKLENIWMEDIVESLTRGGNGVYRIRFNPLELADIPADIEHPVRPIADFISDVSYFLRLSVRKTAEFVFSKERIGERILDLIDVTALISVEPFHELVKKHVDLEAIRRSGKQLRMMATKWDYGNERTGLGRMFSNQDMVQGYGHTAILASAAIPCLFPPVELDGHYYVDGGVAMNTPLSPAVQAGATVVHVVDLEADAGKVTHEDLDSTLASMLRTMSIAMSGRIVSEIERVKLLNRLVELGAHQGEPVTVHRYHPSQPLGGPMRMLDFGKEYVTDLIGRGLADTRAHDCREAGCLIARAPKTVVAAAGNY